MNLFGAREFRFIFSWLSIDALRSTREGANLMNDAGPHNSAVHLSWRQVVKHEKALAVAILGFCSTELSQGEQANPSSAAHRGIEAKSATAAIFN